MPNPKSSRWGGGVTADEMLEMQWVKPELVAQIRFVEWTAEGRLRHAAFLGLRSDKSAREVRTYFYCPGTLCATDKVIEECARQRSTEIEELYRTIFMSIFDRLRPQDRGRVDALRTKLGEFHNDNDDCQILAEAIEGQASVFLTYDRTFLARLSPRVTALRMLQPSAYWSSLCIPRNAKLDKQPHPTNPLSKESWWRW